MVRADKQELIEILGLNETLDELPKTNEMEYYGHV